MRWVLEAECTKAKELVEAITTSHMAIENILSGLDREADKSTYAKLFPESGGDEVSPTSLPFEISYDEKSRIITIKRSSEYREDEGRLSWGLDLGYRLLSGSARKAHRPTQFDLTKVKHSINHGKVIKKQASRIEFTVNKPVPRKIFKMTLGPVDFDNNWADIKLFAEQIRK